MKGFLERLSSWLWKNIKRTKKIPWWPYLVGRLGGAHELRLLLVPLIPDMLSNSITPMMSPNSKNTWFFLSCLKYQRRHNVSGPNPGAPLLQLRTLSCVQLCAEKSVPHERLLETDSSVGSGTNWRYVDPLIALLCRNGLVTTLHPNGIKLRKRQFKI